MDNAEMKIEQIAVIYNDYGTKFGVPRQSGLAPSEVSKIVFCEKYRDKNALRGIGQYSHLWLLWGFSENPQVDGWSPTVRPPRLGGNERVGVFATRSPNRPNPIGLSCVKLERIAPDGENGTALFVSGADLKNGTPIYDIKPYLPYVDSVPGALGGFAEEHKNYKLNVTFADGLYKKVPPEKRAALKETLALDPRPSYQNDVQREYGMTFGCTEIKFKVDGENLTVTAVE